VFIAELTTTPAVIFRHKPKFRTNTALGSDGQGPKGFSFVFLDLFTHLFDFFDIFAEVPGPT
jgi:hypothetical protein